MFKAQSITLSTSINTSSPAHLHLMNLQRLPSLKGWYSKISCIFIFLQIYLRKTHCWILCKMQSPRNNIFSLVLIYVNDKLLSLLCQWQIITKGECDIIFELNRCALVKKKSFYLSNFTTYLHQRRAVIFWCKFQQFYMFQAGRQCLPRKTCHPSTISCETANQVRKIEEIGLPVCTRSLFLGDNL